jgi:NADH-quinone oxidoreductase subunit L
MDWVALIPLLPAISFVVMFPLSRELRKRILWLPVSAMIASSVLSIVALVKVWPGGHLEEPGWSLSWPLGTVGGTPLELGLALDPVAAATLLVVTIVAACVQVYSLGYMHRDSREGWYFAVLSLFTSAMLTLVLSNNLLLTFAMWEMMGLCSYLLIGFWYEAEAPRKASQKAFLTTRVGDLGFLVALFVIFATEGTFDLATVLHGAADWAPGVAVAAAVGLLWAAMGKSAQLPLHVWLPDAMAGPTPASALIHAATMVAAGVFVVARTLPIFEQAPGVMTAMLWIGVATAVAAGLIACVQHDIKKVLAYSTISQLGLMFVALGAGSAVVGMFHLTTHAFFKSLLFLGAGVIIHAAHTQDMREMGGLARHLPVTTVTFTIGSLALAGVFPLAGFFSKDEIITVLVHEHHYAAMALVLFASGLTAFYVTRLWFRVFSGPEQSDELHEAHRSMLAPMSLLALITVGAGFTWTMYYEFIKGKPGHWPDLTIASVSTAVAVLGITVGWWFYGRRSVVVNTRVWKARFGYFYDALVNKLYFDMTYDRLFVKGFFGVAAGAWKFDSAVVDGAVNGAGRGWIATASAADSFDRGIIDGAVNGLAALARSAGSVLRKLQSGSLQNYQRLVVGAVVLLMLILVVTRGA